MIAAVLSRADGAGEVLHGGFVTYTKALKTSALGVSADLLREKSAVNEEVVMQLATGALGTRRLLSVSPSAACWGRRKTTTATRWDWFISAARGWEHSRWS